MSESLERNDNCFVCGLKNPKGLKAHIRTEPGKSHIEITLGSEYEGYKGIIHGGILATLLDEAMAYAVSGNGYWGVTASINVKFKEKVESNRKILVIGEKLESKGNWVKARAYIKYADSENILAEGEGLFKLIKTQD